MMEVVAENSEATLAFRKLAAIIMRFLAGDDHIDLIEPMERCLDALDLEGGTIELIDFSKAVGDDQTIVLIMQGVLRMLAGVLETMDTDDPEYRAGLSTLSRGVVQLGRELQKRSVGWKQ